MYVCLTAGANGEEVLESVGDRTAGVQLDGRTGQDNVKQRQYRFEAALSVAVRQNIDQR